MNQKATIFSVKLLLLSGALMLGCSKDVAKQEPAATTTATTTPTSQTADASTDSIHTSYTTNTLNAAEAPPPSAPQTSDPAAPAEASKALSASELAAALERQLTAGRGIEMSFTMGNAGKVRIVASTSENKVRIESSDVTIVSDGKTVFNWKPSKKLLTIDNVSNAKESMLTNAQALFQFSKNYQAVLLHPGPDYELVLVPDAKLRDLFANAGGITELQLTVTEKNGKLTVGKADAVTASGSQKAGNLAIRSLAAIPVGTFELVPPTGAKVIDLRD